MKELSELSLADLIALYTLFNGKYIDVDWFFPDPNSNIDEINAEIKLRISKIHFTAK